MTQILINENGVVSLGSIDREEDLKTKPGININPPPEDGNCECCGRHISEVKPFGGPGDPLVGDFTGAYLVKKWRSVGPYDEEAEVAVKEAYECYENDGFDDPLDWMIDKYGKEKGEYLYYTSMMYNGVGKSWECRDCAVLQTNEYYEKLRQRYESSTISSSQKECPELLALLDNPITSPEADQKYFTMAEAAKALGMSEEELIEALTNAGVGQYVLIEDQNQASR